MKTDKGKFNWPMIILALSTVVFWYVFVMSLIEIFKPF